MNPSSYQLSVVQAVAVRNLVNGETVELMVTSPNPLVNGTLVSLPTELSYGGSVVADGSTITALVRPAGVRVTLDAAGVVSVIVSPGFANKVWVTHLEEYKVTILFE
jgi:hypothetical protein